MLKIVDYYPNTKIPFPLKELEKFGFEQISSFWYAKNIFEDSGDTITISVNTVTRDIQLSWSSYGNSIAYTYNLDIIFNLIQAGLVEKVEENNANEIHLR